MNEQLFDPALQAGFGTLCVVMIAIQFWVIKKLFSMLKNDLDHLKGELEQIKSSVRLLKLAVEFRMSDKPLPPDLHSGNPKKTR